jgi:hypothetical protein
LLLAICHRLFAICYLPFAIGYLPAKKMHRQVKPELLDTLPPDDPLAQASRNDLHRLNAWMGHGRIMSQSLRAAASERVPQHLIEIGAGDGLFMLRVAQRLSPTWSGIRATLLDKQSIVRSETFQTFQTLGWRAESVESDVFAWLRKPEPLAGDVVIANLFLHHFSAAQLQELLRGLTQRTNCFLALEPRRSALSLGSSRLVGLIGCNRVTRHDATVSVRAGFTGNELSRLWPADRGWTLQERPAGLFSHLFIARRLATEPVSVSGGQP